MDEIIKINGVIMWIIYFVLIMCIVWFVVFIVDFISLCIHSAGLKKIFDGFQQFKIEIKEFIGMEVIKKIKDVENNKCCICYERVTNHIFIPCGHLSICEICNHIDKCPICRNKGKIYKVYN